jgi:MYXO-CTERM domain-containing protein
MIALLTTSVALVALLSTDATGLWGCLAVLLLVGLAAARRRPNPFAGLRLEDVLMGGGYADVDASPLQIAICRAASGLWPAG